MELGPLVVPLAVFLSVALVVVGVATLNQRQRLLKERVNSVYQGDNGDKVAAEVSGILRDRRLSTITGVDRALRRLRFTEGMAMELSRAALPLRVGEYLLIRLGAAFVLALLPMAAGLPFVAAPLLGVVGFYFPKLYVKGRQRRRWRKLDDQLVDLTSMLANSLKAGSSFVQGLELASREMPAPICEEVSQVLAEMSLGGGVEEALTNLTNRVDSYDLNLIVTAMLIQRHVGGNLAEILDTISGTIRARIRMLREIRALTAEARLSAYVVGLLPFFMIAIMSVVNRGYIFSLLTSSMGQAMLAAALVMEILGFALLRRITAIEV